MTTITESASVRNIIASSERSLKAAMILPLGAHSIWESLTIERDFFILKKPCADTYDLPDCEPDAILSICDTKDTGKDYAFLPVGYIYGKDVYIDDCVCDNSLPEVTDARCAEILVRKKVQMCRFESNSAGGRIADKVNEAVKAAGHRCHITKRFTTANKLTKIIQNSSYVKEHFLFP